MPTVDLARLTDDEAAAMRALAVRLFAAEAARVLAALETLAKTGRDPDDPAVRLALRRLLAAYQSERGAFRRAWEAGFATLILGTMAAAAAAFARASGTRTAPAAALRPAAEVRARELARQVTQTTAKRVTAAVRTGVAAGAEMAEITRLVRDAVYVPGVSQRRATAIAATESAGAASDGVWEAAVTSGAFTRKRWLHSGQPMEPRPSHLAAHGEVRPLRERFSTGLLRPRESGAAIEDVAGCTCSLDYLR